MSVASLCRSVGCPELAEQSLQQPFGDCPVLFAAGIVENFKIEVKGKVRWPALDVQHVVVAFLGPAVGKVVLGANELRDPFQEGQSLRGTFRSSHTIQHKDPG